MVAVDGPQKFIGCVVAGTSRADSPKGKEEVLDSLIKNNNWLTLQPVYEFHTPLVHGPDGIARQSIVTPLEFTLDEKLKHYVCVDRLTFFSDMQEPDLEIYEEFIKAAEASMSKARAARSGLELKDNGGLIIAGR